MKILFIDTFGDALDLVLRSQEAGHECIHYISASGSPKDRYGQVGLGLTKVVREWKPFIRGVDLTVLCDNVTHLDAIDKFRAEFPDAAVFGPTKEMASWETDRLKGMQVLKDHGIACPDYKLCTSYEDAVAYVKKYDGRLVSKPCGDADKALSYCSKGPEDMLFMLKKWKNENLIKDKFILQEFIPGIEFAVGSYCGKDGFGGGFEENFEHKKLMNGEVGPATGEMGTVLQIVEKSRLARQMLAPLERTLVKRGFTGDIDVNCIIDEKGKPWPLEFTMRMGYPALQIQTPLFPKDPVSWMLDMCRGTGEPNFTKDVVSLGVSLCMPPFPYPSYPAEKARDYPIFGVTPQLKKVMHPYHIKAGSETAWATAGDYALVVTGVGRTVAAASKRAYGAIKQIYIPGSPMYRTDIGEKVIKDFLPQLHKFGYALGFN